MKPALGYNWEAGPWFWSDIPSGVSLQQLESSLLQEKLTNCFGHHFLKVGALAAELDTSFCTINHQINLINKKSRSNSKTGLVAEYDELPVQNDGVDVVLLPHVIEYSIDPHHVLREAHRVLRPNGKLLITVFNPYSFLMFHKIWPINKSEAIKKTRLFSIARIKDWLNLLGFEIKDVEYACYHSLLKNNLQLDQGMLSRSCAKWLPTMGATCLITAKKREWPLTPIRPRVRYRSSFSPAITGVQANRVKEQ